MSWKGVLVGVISVGALSYAACNPGYVDSNNVPTTPSVPAPASNSVNGNPDCSGQVDGGTAQDRANMERMIQKFCDDMQKQLDQNGQGSNDSQDEQSANTLESS